LFVQTIKSQLNNKNNEQETSQENQEPKNQHAKSMCVLRAELSQKRRLNAKKNSTKTMQTPHQDQHSLRIVVTSLAMVQRHNQWMQFPVKRDSFFFQKKKKKKIRTLSSFDNVTGEGVEPATGRLLINETAAWNLCSISDLESAVGVEALFMTTQ
jgi:hypothetical protein